MKISGAIYSGLCFLLIHIGINAQNAPVSTMGSYAGNNPSATIPITVTNFNNIGSCNLKLTYDASIALAMDVTPGQLLGGQLATNLSEPGIITLGWYTYPGLTLPDNTVMFNIEFSQVTSGYTDIIWEDDGYSCAWSDDAFNYLNDLPTSTYYINGSLNFQLDIAPHTIAPNTTTCNDPVIDIPVQVTGFSNIGAVSLTLHYDASSISFQSYTNNSGFPGLIVNESSPGVITTAGFTASPDGFSLTDSSVFFTIHCNNLGNSTELNWYDDGISCEYAGPAPSYTVLEDTPQELFYIDGSFTKLQIPGSAATITGPVGGGVCQGEIGVTFSVDPISNATEYDWTLPDGAFISSGVNTNNITVSFSENANSGNVTVFGFNECGNGDVSPAFSLTVSSPPAILEQPISPDTVIAGSGTAIFTIVAEGSNLEYQWQEYITDWENISPEGVYSGVFTETLTISNPPVTMNGYKYRCVITGVCEPFAISDGLATLTIISITNVNPESKEYDTAKNPLKFYAYPNPFKDEITFSYISPEKGKIIIEIRNMFGELIETYTDHVNNKGIQYQTLRLNPTIPGFYSARIIYLTNKGSISATTKIICNEYKN